MSVRMRLGARTSAAAVALAVPISMGAVTPVSTAMTSVSSSTSTSSAASSASSASSATVSPGAVIEPVTPSVDSWQRHYLSHVSPGLRPQLIEQQTTIAGGLALRTRAERHRKISVTSAKGSHTWTASALAEHDLPSAAMRAYKHAAHTINASRPGCRMPWTLLAGIGRVESDHGRYGGSVLGADGVPRPAIVGVALNGKGPVAAIRDTDHGAFDGDTVWDRAVGPMQFIPSTWRTAGRDGDGDGKRSPNDIDDAALAAAAYLCGSRDLSSMDAQRAAIFSYNPSTYYVDLVSAFARGYRTGTFVIPSPPVAQGAGDGVVHLHADKAAHKVALAKKAHAKKARAKKARAKALKSAKAAKVAKKKAAAARAKRAHRHAPAPKPAPPKKAPKPTTVRRVLTGRLVAGHTAWTVAGTTFRVADLGGTPLAPTADLDGDGVREPLATELDGVVDRDGTVQLSVTRTGTVTRLTRLAVLSYGKPLPAPTPTPAPTKSPTKSPAKPAGSPSASPTAVAPAVAPSTP
jgi:membrane-bound lytic murein transglycosylase B